MNTRATIDQADYRMQVAQIRAIRFAVFVDEQSVPPDIEMDDRDPHCIHLLAFVDGQPVGTARIDIEKAGKVGRLAVLEPYRRQGIGQALMERCHDIARAHRLAEVWCNAQLTAVPLYQRIGYSIIGDEFEEAGIRHLKMSLKL